MTAEHGDAALALAERLGPVFPCLASTNGPAIASAHPEGDPRRGVCRGACGRNGHGFYDATTDPERITSWWTRRGDASIGVRTGVACDVLDIDHIDFLTGVADLPACETAGGPVVRSGGGKWHVYFKATGLGRRIRFSKHCDWLGTDGYVIAPPSRHPSGGRYSWFAPAELELTDAPPELLDAVRIVERPPVMPAASPLTLRPIGRGGGWSSAGLVGRLVLAVEGERNEVLCWAAHRVGADCHAGKVDRRSADEAVEQLHAVALSRGLTEREVVATVRSGYQAGLSGRPGKRGVA